jgi:hypothetical protein
VAKRVNGWAFEWNGIKVTGYRMGLVVICKFEMQKTFLSAYSRLKMEGVVIYKL